MEQKQNPGNVLLWGMNKFDSAFFFEIKKPSKCGKATTEAMITGSTALLGAAHLRAACLCSLGRPEDAWEAGVW